LAGYGCSMIVGLGIPIPILNEELAYFTGISDKNIYCPVVDYGFDYPNAVNRKICEISYAELKSGRIEIEGQSVQTSPLSSYSKAKEIAGILKSWISSGKFTLGEPQILLPSAPYKKVNYEV